MWKEINLDQKSNYTLDYSCIYILYMCVYTTEREQIFYQDLFWPNDCKLPEPKCKFTTLGSLCDISISTIENSLLIYAIHMVNLWPSITSH
jgi:hypothetical protein